MSVSLDELLARFRERGRLSDSDSPDFDCEVAHLNADDLLLDYINDPEITEAYNSFGKWYA